MNYLKSTGWFQILSEILTADSPAVALPSPTEYEVYCLVMTPASNDVYVVTDAGSTISAMLTTSDGYKIYGMFAKGVQLYAYAAAPTTIRVTPFGDPSGEMTELPVVIPDVGGTVSYVPWSVYVNAHESFQVDHDSNIGTYRVQNVPASANFNYTFCVPDDFASLVRITLHYINNSANPGPQPINFESMYHQTGEAYNIHNQTLFGTITLIPLATIGGSMDISSLFTGITRKDKCGINVDHQGIGGVLSYLGLYFEYLRIVV